MKTSPRSNCASDVSNTRASSPTISSSASGVSAFNPCALDGVHNKMSDVKSKSTQELLASEKDFFDRESAELRDEGLALKPHTIDRYRNARPKIGNFSKDNLFAKIMPLEGMRVLDYGCGAGE